MADQVNKYVSDIISGFAFLVLSLFVMLRCSNMVDKAARFPKLLAYTLALFSTIFIITNISKWYKSRVSKQFTEKDEKFTIKTSKEVLHKLQKEVLPLSVPIISVIFVVTLPLIGFEIGALAFMLVCMFLLGGKKTIRYILVPVITTVVLSLLFRVGLDVRLPIGFWPF